MKIASGIPQLNQQGVGVRDSFFEPGVILLATQAVTRIRGALQMDLPLRTMFETPSVAALSHLIEPILSGFGMTKSPAAERDEQQEEAVR